MHTCQRSHLSSWMRGLGALALAAAALTACNPEAPAPTATPIPPSATKQPEPTATPRPSATPTERPSPTPDLDATATAEAEQLMAELMAEVEPVLSELGYSSQEGYLGWISPFPLELVVNEYGTIIYTEMDETNVYADFILHVEVIWDSTSGLAGCGVILRSEHDLEQGEQIQFATVRLSGQPMWDVELWQYGEWQSTLSGSLKASAAIDVDSGASNTYVLVADGNLLTAYANGTRLGSVTILRRQEGRLGVFGWQESGRTTCTFDNGWIWVLEK